MHYTTIYILPPIYAHSPPSLAQECYHIPKIDETVCFSARKVQTHCRLMLRSKAVGEKPEDDLDGETLLQLVPDGKRKA